MAAGTVLSVWPIVGKGANHIAWRDARLAMAVRATHAHDRLHEIQSRHWEQLARASGVPDLFDSLVALALQVPQVLEQARALLPRGFPATVFSPIRPACRPRPSALSTAWPRESSKPRRRGPAVCPRSSIATLELTHA